MKKVSAFSLTLPIMLGYIPIGITFGLLAFQQGIGFLPTFLFSSVVFAGSAQFAVLGMIAVGSPSVVQVLITVFLINLRNFILSLAYLPHTKTWTFFEKIRFFPILTDENFALLSGATQFRRDPKFAYSVSLYAYFSWQIGTILGYFFGKLIPDPSRLGLDFALSALFIGIIVLFINRFEQIATLVVSIIFMIILYLFLDVGRLSVMISAILASLVGWRLECMKKSI